MDQVLRLTSSPTLMEFDCWCPHHHHRSSTVGVLAKIHEATSISTTSSMTRHYYRVISSSRERSPLLNVLCSCRATFWNLPTGKSRTGHEPSSRVAVRTKMKEFHCWCLHRHQRSLAVGVLAKICIPFRTLLRPPTPSRAFLGRED